MGLKGEMIVNVNTKKPGRGCSSRDNFVAVEDEDKVAGTSELFGVLGKDAEFSFVRGDLEAPGTEPLGDMVQGGLEVGYDTGAFAAMSAWERAVKIGVICKLRAGYVLRNGVRKVKDKDEKEGWAKDTALGDSVRHGDGGAEDTIMRDPSGTALEVVN
jgi:hypothetical protein